MAQYTSGLEDSIWILADQLDQTAGDDEGKVVLDFLNDSNSFLTFGEGILRTIQRLDPAVTKDTAAQYIRNACQKNNVPVKAIASPATLSNWFSKGMRPKKGDASRTSMFALAFALGLNVEQTQALFHQVYLDRAFNYRSEDEVVYYYCLQNGLGWADAARILERISFAEQEAEDATVFTSILRAGIAQNGSEQELIDYIQTHAHNFQKNSVTATKEFDRLLTQAKMAAKEELTLPENETGFAGSWKNGEAISNNLLFEVITNVSVSGDKGTRTIFKNAQLPTEIRNRFPEAVTLGKTDMTHEERRKVMILLFSYHVWSMVQWRGVDYDIEDYTEELNALLFSCNYPPLYFGNPFDWMFLFCAQAERPLDLFRGLLQEILKEE